MTGQHMISFGRKFNYWIFDCLEWEEKHSRTLSTVPQSQRFLESTRMSEIGSQSPQKIAENIHYIHFSIQIVLISDKN
jgi:hypothetical protein